MVFRIFSSVVFLFLSSPALADKKVDCLVAQQGCPIYTEVQQGCDCTIALVGYGQKGYSCCCQNRDRMKQIEKQNWDRMFGK